MLMIAGPNGAGKSTFWQRMLRSRFPPGTIKYINADEIQRDLNPAGPLAAVNELTSRMAQQEAEWLRKDMLRRPPDLQSHFAYETVFSDPYGHKLAELRAGRAAGYFVVMVFVGIADVETSMSRVAARVLTGGHDVPQDRQRARFERVYANGRQALDIVDLALVLDNSTDVAQRVGTHRPVAVFRSGVLQGVCAQPPLWWPLLVPPAGASQ